jgi:[ribosomal protein S5]-alanine N-acetyltransferase
MQTEIFTQRLVLNLITEADDDFMRTLVNTEGWLKFIGDRNVHSKQDAIAYIQRIKNTPNLFYWVVRLKDNDTPLGIISFIKRSYLEHFDIGFAFLTEYNGCGYAYEAAEKVLSIASKKLEYSTILATTIPQNIASIKLLNKLGLHFEREIEVANETLHVYSN